MKAYFTTTEVERKFRRFGKTVQILIKKHARERAEENSDSLDLRSDLYGIGKDDIAWGRRVSKDRVWKEVLVRWWLTKKPFQIHFTKNWRFSHYGLKEN